MSNMKQYDDGKIRDVDIRLAFVRRNMKFFENKDYEFVNEFGINSTNIVDLASFDFKNKIFFGFEIKSEMDNTKRLYDQLNSYITFFNFVYVICHTKHLQGVLDMIEANKQFHKVGVIKVDSDLNFTEVRRAKKYTQFFALFAKNLELDELRTLAVAHGINSAGNKTTLLEVIRRHITLDEIYNGIKNKLRNTKIHKCPFCGSKLYYNTSNRSGRLRVCYKCGKSTYEE